MMCRRNALYLRGLRCAYDSRANGEFLAVHVTSIASSRGEPRPGVRQETLRVAKKTVSDISGCGVAEMHQEATII